MNVLKIGDRMVNLDLVTDSTLSEAGVDRCVAPSPILQERTERARHRAAATHDEPGPRTLQAARDVIDDDAADRARRMMTTTWPPVTVQEAMGASR